MTKTTSILGALAIAGAMGIGVGPPAAADDSNCQDIGGTTVCAQGGDIRGGDPYADNSSADTSNGPVSIPTDGGCLTPYGTYQNCNAGAGGG